MHRGQAKLTHRPLCALEQNGKPVGGHFFAQSSFADYAVANERNAVKVRSDAPLELLGPLGCGVQTGAGAVMNALQAKLQTCLSPILISDIPTRSTRLYRSTTRARTA